MKTDKLLGDRIEEVLNLLHVDQITKVVETITKKPCKCSQRKEYLNKLHRQMCEMKERIMHK